MALSTRPSRHAASPLEALLYELLAEVRKIREVLEQPRRPAASLTREDRVCLAKLLPAIGGALGSEPFTSRDLPDASAGLRVVLRGFNVKQIGRLLSRAAGVPIDGWIVERCGVEINVTLWRVLATVSHR